MAGPDHSEFKHQDDNRVFNMRRSLLPCIRFASIAMLWIGVLSNLATGQDYPAYNFGSSPAQAQSLWSGTPKVGKINNALPKSPLGQIHYASQPSRHPTPANTGNAAGFGPNQFGANLGSGLPANAYQGVNPATGQPIGDLARHHGFRRGQQGIPAAPGGVVFNQPGVQGFTQPGVQGFAQPGVPIGPAIDQVSPLGIPLESMAPVNSGFPVQSSIGATPNVSAPSGIAPANAGTSAVNQGWTSGNFDTTGNYNIEDGYNGNFLNGNSGQAGGVSLPAAPGQGRQKNATGLFFRWDRLWATIDAPTVGSVGDSASEGVFISNGIPQPFFNSLSGDFIDDRPDFGDRIEFGFADPNTKRGWVASILFLDQAKTTTLAGGSVQFSDPFGLLLGFLDGNGDGIDDDVDGDRIYGRNGRDLGVPDGENPGTFFPFYDGIPDDTSAQDNGDLVTFLPVFDELSVTNRLDISGFELTRVRAFGRGNRASCAHVLLGVRYVDIDEDFFLRGTGSFLDETTVRTNVENFIIGPQIGVGFCRNNGAWGINGSARALAGVNQQRGRQTAILGSNATDAMGAANSPLNLDSSASSSSQSSTQFSPFFEVRGNVYYNLNSWLSISAGYTGWYTSGISRAAGSIEYSLPSFGFDIDNNDDLLAHALTFGLQGNF